MFFFIFTLYAQFDPIVFYQHNNYSLMVKLSILLFYATVWHRQLVLKHRRYDNILRSAGFWVSWLASKQSAVRESANSPITHRKNTFLRSVQYKGNYARPMWAVFAYYILDVVCRDTFLMRITKALQNDWRNSLFYLRSPWLARVT